MVIPHGARYVEGIADDKAVHPPFALNNVDYIPAQVRGHAIDRIVCRHHRLGAAFFKWNLECLKVVFAHVARIEADGGITSSGLIIVTDKVL